MNFRPLFFLSFLPVIALAYACSDDETPTPAGPTPTNDAGPGTGTDAASDVDSTPPTPTPQPVEIKFEARVGAEVFACGKTFTGVGTSNASATAADFRFFVHDVRLLKGSEEVPVTLDAAEPWQSARLGLLDFEDKTGECQLGTSGTNDVLRGKVLGGTYDGIAFTIGVPEDLNHKNKDTEAAPLPNSGLNWDWTTGYIHFALQLSSNTVADGGRVPTFFAHVGSTQCSGDPADGGMPGCARKNRPVVRLTGFDPAKNKIVVDAKTLLEDSNIDVNTPGTMPGCMSSPTDPECTAVFARLGLDIETGAPAATAQTVFSVEAR